MASVAADERRKSTPPDLLALSNLYFDRRQRLLTADEQHRRRFLSESTHALNRPAVPLIPEARRPNTTPEAPAAASSKPRKLAPLRPTVEEARVRIDDRKAHGGLHLSVNFSRQGWRQQQQRDDSQLAVKEEQDMIL